jgi:hypothetical protein
MLFESLKPFSQKNVIKSTPPDLAGVCRPVDLFVKKTDTGHILIQKG